MISINALHGKSVSDGLEFLRNDDDIIKMFRESKEINIIYIYCEDKANLLRPEGGWTWKVMILVINFYCSTGIVKTCLLMII